MTCQACSYGNHLRCTQAQEWATDDHGVQLVCCCNEGCHIGHADYPEVPNWTDADPCGCWRQYDRHSELGPVATYQCAEHARLSEVER